MATLGERRLAVDYVDLRDLPAVRAALRPSTRAIWIESPTNPCMNLVDMAEWPLSRRERNLLTICETTLFVAVFPAASRAGHRYRGALHHQYINGHSDVWAGHRGARRGPGRAPRLPAERAGDLPGAFDCFLCCAASRRWRCAWRSTTATRWRSPPGWSGIQDRRGASPGPRQPSQHALALQADDGYGGHLLVSRARRTRGGVPAARNLKVFTLAESLGESNRSSSIPTP